MALKLDFNLDSETYRNYLNGHPVVMHSHHYLALITKLAEEMNDLEGLQILKDVVEESMRAVFDDYIEKNALTSPLERCNVGREYYSAFGLGKMIVTGSESGGEVRLVRSHLDEGWVRKWGAADRPVNHFTCGYIAAVFASAFNKPTKSYTVTEVASMAAGENEGKFIVKLS
ncbi:MAG TPA: 4-vinyl reductase [Geobacteraceae bacterium]